MILDKITEFLGISKKTPESNFLITKEDLIQSTNLGGAEEVVKPNQGINRQLLIEWSTDVAPEKLPQKYKSALIIIGFLMILYSVITMDFIFVIMVLSLLFLYNVTVSSPKKKYTYSIYTTGFDYLGTFYSWKQVQLYFFFSDRNIIGVDTVDVFPGRLYLYFNPEDRAKIDEIMINYLNKSIVAPKSYIDRIVDRVKPYLNLKD